MTFGLRILLFEVHPHSDCSLLNKSEQRISDTAGPLYKKNPTIGWVLYESQKKKTILFLLP